MKDFNVWVFISGLVITAFIGFLSIFLTGVYELSGLIMVATAILYVGSLENTKNTKS